MRLPRLTWRMIAGPFACGTPKGGSGICFVALLRLTFHWPDRISGPRTTPAAAWLPEKLKNRMMKT